MKVSEEIDRVKKAEADASQQAGEAREKAARILEEARQEGRELIRGVRSKVSNKEAELREQATREGEGVVASLQEENEKELDLIEKATKENMEQAVRYVIERLTSYEG